MTDSVTNDEELVEGEASAEGEARAEPPLDAGDAAPVGGDRGEPEPGEPEPGEPEPDESVVDMGLEPAAEGEVELQEEYDELHDRHLRLVAEFNNFRRRTEQERLSAWARAQADVVAKFLDVLDDLNRVAELDLSNATVDAIIEGVDLVERKFVRMLEDSGVEVFDPTGEVFDPERMEAMMRLPAESDEQDDEVAQVFQKGYSLKGILVRPARVSVYKNG